MARRKLNRTACKHKMSDHKSRSNDNSTKENEDGHDTPSISDGGGSNVAPSTDVPEDGLTHSRSEAGLPIATATSGNVGSKKRSQDEAKKGSPQQEDTGSKGEDCPKWSQEKHRGGRGGTLQKHEAGGEKNSDEGIAIKRMPGHRRDSLESMTEEECGHSWTEKNAENSDSNIDQIQVNPSHQGHNYDIDVSDSDSDDKNETVPQKREVVDSWHFIYIDTTLKIVNTLLVAILLGLLVTMLLRRPRQVAFVKQYTHEHPWLQVMIGGQADDNLPELNITTPVKEPDGASQVISIAEGDTLSQALYSVKVSKRDADEVQRGLEGELFSKWHESCRVSTAKGIAIQDLDEFLDQMADGYNMSADVRDQLNIVQQSTEWTETLIEFKYSQPEDDSSIKYGMIAFGKSPNGKTVDMAYVQYAMDFKLAPERIIVQYEKNYLWGLINYKGPQDELRRERVLSTATMKQIRNFFRLKALQGFQEEGVIDKIQYIDTQEDVNE